MPEDYSFRPYPRYLLRKKLIAEIVERQDVSEKTCLEIGYGHGDLLFYLGGRFRRAFGYDSSANAIEIVRRRLANNPNQSGKIEIITSSDGLARHSYDCIVACEVLEHIRDDTSTLIFWRDLLNDDGILIISVPAHQKRWASNDEVSGHFRRYEKDELTAKLQRTGFRLDTFWSYGYPLITLLDYCLNRRAQSKLRDNFGTSQPELVTKEQLTGKSFMGGDCRGDAFFSSNLVLFPFFFLQKLFLNRDLSSAYLVAARKA